ncbi:hypothetical protein BON22_5487 [Cyberlindnera fabianii]|uniref:Uncharacterized protein n=1 Tax=Cyberlindnera fabianii TaxID=36022 RepID=A0A1V2KYE9_CYBFA|nr:hypothetical protein BON22_5487 [Cyberlindnera fabianii]
MTKPKDYDDANQGQFYDNTLPIRKIYTKLYEDSRGVTWSVARSRAQKYLPVLNKHPDILQELQGMNNNGDSQMVVPSLAQRQTTKGDVLLVKIGIGP